MKRLDNWTVFNFRFNCFSSQGCVDLKSNAARAFCYHVCHQFSCIIGLFSVLSSVRIKGLASFPVKVQD